MKSAKCKIGFCAIMYGKPYHLPDKYIQMQGVMPVRIEYSLN